MTCTLCFRNLTLLQRLVSLPPRTLSQQACLPLNPMHIRHLSLPLLCGRCCRAGLSAKGDASSKGQLSGVLAVAVKAVTVAGLLAVTFGPPYSFTLLRAVYSQRWSDTEAPFVLGCYTAYLLLLAVNGA